MPDANTFDKIIELVNRTGILSSVTLHLKTGGMIRGIPTGIEIQNNQSFVAVLDETSSKTRYIPAAHITDVSE